MKKRGFSLLLAILILAAQIPFAFAVTASGTCGDNLTWTLDDSGTLTINGTGAMYDYDGVIASIGHGTYPPWYNYKSAMVKVVINAGVTNIGAQAFCDCDSVSEVVLPNTVTKVGQFAFHAFSTHSMLRKITIPQSVISIEDFAFANCHNLQEIKIPNSVTNIGIRAFSSCDSIKSITIPSGLTNISDEMLYSCDNLMDVTLPDSIRSIGKWAFAECPKLMNITIPKGVTSIGDKAFSGCYLLKSIIIPNGVTAIELGTFSECFSLESISLPDSITTIGKSAFLDCNSLRDVYYGGGSGGDSHQWQAVSIQSGNENLENAIIHYNSSSSDSEPIAPTINDIGQYSYAFNNSAKSFGYPLTYRFPLERFQLVYGDGFAKKMKAVDFGDGTYWSGNCYGIATTAAMLSRAGSGVTPSAFRNGATLPGELRASDTNAEWGLTLTQFIEAMQISQYSSTFAATRKQNRNQISSLLSAMSAFEKGGFGPLVICVYGEDRNGNYSGHALLAYHLDGQRLYIYDCNYPNDGNRYITISENSWSYPIFDDVTWNNSNGEITYIQYETYLMDWYNRGNLLGDPEQLRQVMFFINAADATISDSRGNEVATFRKGRMVSGIDEAFPIPPLGVTVDGVSAVRPQIAVWLPYTDEYKVTTEENATVSAVNVSKGVSVNSVAGGQTVSVPLASTFGDVSPEQYFYVPVQWAVGRGITNGTTATTFSPHKTCTRNHILTFLWRAKGSPAAMVRNPFSDVDVSGDFGKAALWAYEKGLVSGKQFNGGTPCSRADVVTYLWKLAGRPSARRSAFTDVPSNADYARAVSWAVECGVTNGTSETTFNPSGICTRAQIVTFLYRAYAES